MDQNLKYVFLTFKVMSTVQTVGEYQNNKQTEIAGFVCMALTETT